MDGNHGELILHPFLDVPITELHGHLARSLHRERSMEFLSVDVDRQISGETFEARWPSSSVVEGAAQRFARSGIIGYGGLFWRVRIHREISFRWSKVARLLYLLGFAPLNGEESRARWHGRHFQTKTDSDIVRQFVSCRLSRVGRICSETWQRGWHGTTGRFSHGRRRDEPAPSSFERREKRRSEGGRQAI